MAQPRNSAAKLAHRPSRKSSCHSRIVRNRITRHRGHHSPHHSSSKGLARLGRNAPQRCPRPRKLARSPPRPRCPVPLFAALRSALDSPATWLLHRAIVRTGEEISDEDAIAATPDRTTYVEILLDFMQRAARPNPVEVAMARYDQPKTRIRLILNTTAGAHRATRAGIVSTLAIILPLSCLAAVVYPRHSSPQPSASVLNEAMPAIPAAAPLPELAQVTAPPLPSPPQVPEKLPQFEVATIKLSPHGLTGFEVFPGGRLVAHNLPLKSLIYAAFQVPYSRIQGGEDWTESERYVIEAKPSESIGVRIGNLRYSIRSFGLFPRKSGWRGKRSTGPRRRGPVSAAPVGSGIFSRHRRRSWRPSPVT